MQAVRVNGKIKSVMQLKQINEFLDNLGPVAFSVLLIGLEVTAGLMFLCAVLPLFGQAQLYFLAQALGDMALRALWLSMLACFGSYIFCGKQNN